MFVYRRDPDSSLGVGVAFTSADLDLGDRQEAPMRQAAFASLSDELGVPVAAVAQVHGVAVVRVTAPPGASGLVDLTTLSADALVTTQPGLGLAVRVADCVPICLASLDGSAVAAVHAGRQGLLAGVIGQAIVALRELTDAPLQGWVGPHVCAACYEVPEEMAVTAAAQLGTAVSITRWGSQGIDLGGAALRQLAAHGVAVTDVASCTLEDARLHSHRGDPSAAGRQAGVIWRAG